LHSQYNKAMTSDNTLRIRSPRLLDLTVYLIVLIMMGLGLIILPEARTKIVAVALCVAFGLVHAIGFRNANTPGGRAIYFTLQAILVLALMRLSSPSDVFNLLFYILGLEAILVLPARTAVTWIVGFWVVDSVSALWSRGTIGVINVLFYGAAFMLTAVFGYALRQAEIARRQNQQLLEELRATQRQLQDLAVAEERTRLAREMHDSLGHRLTVAVVQLEGAQRLIPTNPTRAAQMISTMRDEMKEALTELRHTVTALRAPIASEPPLDAALATLSQTFQQDTGIPTHLSITPNFPALPEQYRLTFFRAAQEALTNIQRHADAQNAWLKLSADDQNVILVMEDDGKGIDGHDDNSSGSGLLGLKERAAQIGGQVTIAERPGGGAQLILTAPTPELRMT
jgi:signal transduction histidine kinase